MGESVLLGKKIVGTSLVGVWVGGWVGEMKRGNFMVRIILFIAKPFDLD